MGVAVNQFAVARVTGHQVPSEMAGRELHISPGVNLEFCTRGRGQAT